MRSDTHTKPAIKESEETPCRESCLLEVEGLTKAFKTGRHRQVCAVDHVSFSIRAGETLGIVGESGSGKTTLANMLTCLLTPTSGRIWLDGQDVTSLRQKDLKNVYRKVQMVFQSPAGSFDPRRTLGDGICEGMRNQGISKKDARQKAIRLLEKCGLDDTFFGKYPHEVSGGQCQRAAIARAIAVRPALLICDEPTSALDVTVQEEILQLLSSLKKEYPVSYLFICHDLALVRQFCDRVLVMYHGRIVESGPVVEVIFHPRDPYTKKLIDSIL